MPELLPTCAPLYPWLLDRCYRNLRVVRNPADPFSLRHDGQEIEIASRSTDPSTDINIMLIRRDGPPDDRWVCWCRSSNYRVDLLHFATRAVVLDALAFIGHARPWALGRCWSTLTDEQAARVTAEAVRAVGADPKRAAKAIPFGVLSEWITPEELAEGSKPPRSHRFGVAVEWRVLVLGNDDGGRYSGLFPAGWIADFRAPKDVRYMGDERGEEGKAAADEAATASGALLWEQITPPEKADAP